MIFDWSTITFDQSSETKTFWKISSHVSIDQNLFWIDRMFLFNRSTSIENQSKWTESLWWFSLNFWLVKNCFWSIGWSFFDQSSSNREAIESCRKFVKIFFMISIDQGIHSINRTLWISNFHKVFSHLKLQGYVWWDYTWFLIKNLSFKISSGREIQGLDLTTSFISS